MAEPHPDEVVDPKYRAHLHAIARIIDDALNGERREDDPKQHGFIVAMFEMGDAGRFNYMSNCRREDIIVLLKEMTARFEGMPESKGGRA